MIIQNCGSRMEDHENAVVLLKKIMLVNVIGDKRWSHHVY